MGFAKFERSFLAMMERAALGAVHPLTTTRDLASYANRGYVVTGIILGGVCFALYGYLNHPIYEAPQVIINIYNFTIGKIPWWPWRENTNSLLQFPIVLYVAGAVFGKIRQPVGKWVLDAVLASMNFAILLGEWCLENPWKSVFLAMILLCVFVLSVSRSITFATKQQVATNDLNYWFDSAEQLVNHNTMTGPEDEQYGAVHEHWRPEFVSLLQEKSKHHSVQCLMQSLDALYSNLPGTDESWPNTLTLRLPALQNAATACDEAHESVHDPYIDRAFALSHLFLGRVYARLSETPADPMGAIQVHYSRLALEQFVIVENELHGHMSQGDLRYLGEAMNGKGTVYANALTVALQHSQKMSGKALEELQGICVTSYDCVLRGFNAYQESRKTLQGCSFESKRLLNNTVDLLARVGANYTTILNTSSVSPSPPLSNRTELADELQKKLHSQVACVRTEPIVPATIITLAQGYSTLASLHKEIGQPWQDEVRTSGFYLRLASGFLPANVSSWDLSFLCDLYKTDGKAELTDAITLRADTFGRPDAVIGRLNDQCR